MEIRMLFRRVGTVAGKAVSHSWDVVMKNKHVNVVAIDRFARTILLVDRLLITINSSHLLYDSRHVQQGRVPLW